MMSCVLPFVVRMCVLCKLLLRVRNISKYSIRSQRRIFFSIRMVNWVTWMFRALFLMLCCCIICIWATTTVINISLLNYALPFWNLSRKQLFLHNNISNLIIAPLEAKLHHPGNLCSLRRRWFGLSGCLHTGAYVSFWP